MAKPHKTCGSCLFFDHEVLPGEKRLHKDIGKKAHGRPCDAYQVNPFPVLSSAKAVSEWKALSDMISSVPESALENAAHLILQANKLKRYNFKFMQRVAYRWRGQSGDDYLNNFLIAHIVTVDSNRIARLVATDGSIQISAPLTAVFKMARFAKMREAMIRDKHYRDPRYKHFDMPASEISQSDMTVVKTLQSVLGDMDEKMRKFLPFERGPQRIAKNLFNGKSRAKSTRGKNGDNDVKSFNITT